MTQLVLPYSIINNTPADAVQVESNYDVITGFVNTQVINRDGSVGMDAPLLLKGDPTAPNHAANKGYVDSRVAKGGDTMTGSLDIRSTSEEAIRLSKAGAANHSYMAFYDEDKVTRRGWVGVDPSDDIDLTADTGNISLTTTGSGKAIRLVGQSGTYLYGGLNIQTAGPGGYALNVATGPSFIHGGVTIFDSINVASGSLSVASGGAGITGGLTVSGGLNVTSGNFNVTASAGINGSVTIGGTLNVSGQTDVYTNSNYVLRLRGTNNLPMIDFVDSSYASEYGYLQMGPSGATLSHNTGTLNQNAAGFIVFNSGAGAAFQLSGTEYVRLGGPGNGGQFMVGKTATGSASRGVELSPLGPINATTDVGGTSCLFLRQMQGASANDQRYIQCIDHGGTEMGGIVRATTPANGIRLFGAYVTAPSDYRLKNELGPVVDAVARVMQLQPKHLEWKEGGNPFDGFIAHEVQPIIPAAVHGDKDAVYGDDDIGGQPGAVKAQQLDMVQLVPLLTAAIHELVERVEVLEDA